MPRLKKHHFGHIYYSLAGLGLTGAFIPLLSLDSFRGENLPLFLLCYCLAGAAYFMGLARLRYAAISIGIIWGFAIAARLTLLGTMPTLSDDVYRYVWDGHLLSLGVNPYAEPVESPELDAYTTPLRANVNHAWMASPYLPAAQVYFWLIDQAAPQSVKAYQSAAVLFDLLTGLLIQMMLIRLRLNRAAVLIYLWNPLVIVEFAHGAHVDALMLFTTILACAAVISGNKWRGISALALGMAALTKGLPVMLAPLFLRRWQKTGLSVFLLLTGSSLAAFSVNAGWGLTGDLDGRGVFGATRIYARYWQFNAGFLYQLADKLAGLDVLSWMVNEMAYNPDRWAAAGLFLTVLVWSAHKAWKLDHPSADPIETSRSLIRLTLVPIGAYLLLTPAVHPWYLTWALALLPFLYPAPGDPAQLTRWMLPWIYFSLAAAFSYLAYLTTEETDVPNWVIWMEYLPLYTGLAWAAWRSKFACTDNLIIAPNIKES